MSDGARKAATVVARVPSRPYGGRPRLQLEGGSHRVFGPQFRHRSSRGWRRPRAIFGDTIRNVRWNSSSVACSWIRPDLLVRSARAQAIEQHSGELLIGEARQDLLNLAEHKDSPVSEFRLARIGHTAPGHRLPSHSRSIEPLHGPRGAPRQPAPRGLGGCGAKDASERSGVELPVLE